jgi:hypothetical protein
MGLSITIQLLNKVLHKHAKDFPTKVFFLADVWLGVELGKPKTFMVGTET